MTDESRESTIMVPPEGIEPRKPRLLEQVHEAIRRRYFSRRTEEAYAHWIKRFIHFSGRRHPAVLGEAEVTAFLNHLAAERKVAASTQNQALSALLFLYKEVLGRELAWLDGLQRATRPPRLPVVLTHEEVERLLAELQGVRWLIASLLYGAGLRVMECLAPAGEGRRSRLPADPDPRRQGREGPRDDDAGEARGAALRAPWAGEVAARARPRSGIWRGEPALRARAQVSARGLRVALAVRFSVQSPIPRPGGRRDPPPSSL